MSSPVPASTNQDGGPINTGIGVSAASTANPIVPLARIITFITVASVLAFLLNNYLNFWLGWPGLTNLMSHLGVSGFESLAQPFYRVLYIISVNP